MFSHFKPGVPAFSVPQPENAMTVVANRARELKVTLKINDTGIYSLFCANLFCKKTGSL